MDTNGKMIKIMKNDKGIATVYVALIMIALVAFVGLAIDIGYMYVAKGQLQNAADSAALAGIAKLHQTTSITAFGNHSSARREAWRFSCRNKAAGQNVFLVDSGTDCNSPPTDLNNGNSVTGDIVLGHWETTTGFTPADGTNVINAIKVEARRTSESPSAGRIGGNPVSIFFGNIFSLLPGGTGWSTMNAASSAIAAFEPPYIAPFPICLPSCNTETPLNGRWEYDEAKYKDPDNPILCTDENGSPPGQAYYFNSSPQSDPIKKPGLAWTEFDFNVCPSTSCDQPTPGGILEYLNGKPTPDICGKHICTTNGNKHPALARLKDIFDEKKRPYDFNVGGTNITVTGWEIYVPVVSNLSCGTPKNSCPGDVAGQAGAYLVENYARVLVTEVITTGQQGVRFIGFDNPRVHTESITCDKKTKTVNRLVTSVSCMPCDQPLPTTSSSRGKLVK